MAGIVIPDASNTTVPMSPEVIAKAAAEREERRQAELAEQAERERCMTNLAKAIARDSVGFTMGDGSPSALFLERRGLELMDGASPRALRYHEHCPFRDDDDAEVFHPALIAIYRDIITNEVKAAVARTLPVS
jgi:hypothetical protein